MKKIEVAAWRGYNKGDKIQGIGIKHLTKFNYSKEKRNEIIDKILDAGLNLKIQQSKILNGIIIWIDDKRFTQS